MQQLLESWYDKSTCAIATWRGDAQRYWLTQVLDCARMRHDTWLQSTPSQRASLEPAYILGDRKHTPEAQNAVETVLRTELLDAIPKSIADAESSKGSTGPASDSLQLAILGESRARPKDDFTSNSWCESEDVRQKCSSKVSVIGRSKGDVCASTTLTESPGIWKSHDKAQAKSLDDRGCVGYLLDIDVWQSGTTRIMQAGVAVKGLAPRRLDPARYHLNPTTDLNELKRGCHGGLFRMSLGSSSGSITQAVSTMEHPSQLNLTLLLSTCSSRA